MYKAEITLGLGPWVSNLVKQKNKKKNEKQIK